MHPYRNPYSVCHEDRSDPMGGVIYTIDSAARGHVGYVVVRRSGAREYLGIDGNHLTRKPFLLESSWDQAVNDYRPAAL